MHPLVDTCDTCLVNYPLDKDNGRLFIFLEDLVASHVMAKCPTCFAVERIFLDAGGIIQCLGQGMGISYAIHADDRLLRHARTAWRARQVIEVQVPQWMLRQLHDTLREFGGQA